MKQETIITIAAVAVGVGIALIGALILLIASDPDTTVKALTTPCTECH